MRHAIIGVFVNAGHRGWLEAERSASAAARSAVRCMLLLDRFKVRLLARAGGHCAELGDKTVQERRL